MLNWNSPDQAYYYNTFIPKFWCPTPLAYIINSIYFAGPWVPRSSAWFLTCALTRSTDGSFQNSWRTAKPKKCRLGVWRPKQPTPRARRARSRRPSGSAAITAEAITTIIEIIPVPEPQKQTFLSIVQYLTTTQLTCIQFDVKHSMHPNGLAQLLSLDGI